MLSGIKTGKKKRKAVQPAQQRQPEPPAVASGRTSGQAQDMTTGASSSLPSSSPPPYRSNNNNNNLSVAEQLRRSLASSGGDWNNDDKKHRKSPSAAAPTTTTSDLPYQVLERSGRIKAATPTTTKASDAEDDAGVTVVHLPETSSRAERLLSGESDKTTTSLFARKSMSMDEELARNVVRLGKKRRQKMTTTNNIDSDEEEHRLLSLMMAPSECGAEESNNNKKPKQKQDAADNKAKHRAISRELALNDTQDRITSKCWWWLESSQFAKHRLLSLGNHVSLVMAPPNLSLTPGRHFYIVPLKHAESLAACEDEVWDEIVRFQTSLRSLFQKEFSSCLLFSETVLPTQNFWQTRMEAIPIKRKLWLDSELYFKSTLTEQADELFGTHNKLLSTKGKGLRRTVPKKSFPYFYIEWDSPDQGYAQIIENASFPPDFAADVIAGMAGQDPLRFQRKKKFSGEQEKQYILEFLKKWKLYDWTDQLDS